MKKIRSLYLFIIIVFCLCTTFLYGQTRGDDIFTFNVECPVIKVDNISGTKLADKHRIKIGVAETAKLYIDNKWGPAIWKIISGNGTLTTFDSVSVIFEAPIEKDVVTIEVTPTKACSNKIKNFIFTVIPPQSVSFDQVCKMHIKDRNTSGLVTINFLMPDEVSFENLQVKELDAPLVATGAFAFSNNSGHQPGLKYQPCQIYIDPGFGTFINGDDLATALTKEDEPKDSIGNYVVNIPWVYQKKGSKDANKYYLVENVLQKGYFERFYKDGKAIRSETTVSKSNSSVMYIKTSASEDCSGKSF